MRIVVFGPQQRLGAWEGETVVDLNRAFADALRGRNEQAAQGEADTRLPTRLEAFIAAGPPALEDARRAVEHAAGHAPDNRVVYRAAEVTLHAPWPGRRIACAGGNYADHLLGMRAHQPGGEPVTLEQITAEARAAEPWGFWKVPDAVAGPEAAIPYPQRTRLFDYEGEAAIVLGRRGKDIRAEDLPAYVWGVTLLNDWSIRDGARNARLMSFNLAKNFDGATSLGPCIVVGELDPQAREVATHVNGQLRQQYSTRSMIWSFGEILAFLSQDFTFVPGDVIAAGTAAGTAADRSPPRPDGSRPLDLFLKPGDVVEVSSPRIGTLRNTIQ